MMTLSELKDKVATLEPCFTIYDFVDEKSVTEVARLAIGQYDDRALADYKITYLAEDIRYVEVEFA